MTSHRDIETSQKQLTVTSQIGHNVRSYYDVTVSSNYHPTLENNCFSTNSIISITVIYFSCSIKISKMYHLVLEVSSSYCNCVGEDNNDININIYDNLKWTYCG